MAFALVIDCLFRPLTKDPPDPSINLENMAIGVESMGSSDVGLLILYI